MQLLLCSCLLFRCKHRVPSREHCRLLLEHVENLCGYVLLVYYKAEHILIEPRTGHYECAVETRLCALTVLNLPHLGLLFIVKVYGHRCCDAQEWQRLQ